MINDINKKMISRRNFIKVSGMSGAVLALGFSYGCSGGKGEAVLENVSAFDSKTAKEISPFILIDSKGAIVLMAHKPEMGQGTFQSMPLIIAEELGVSLDQVTIMQAPVDKKYGGMSVGGSYSVRGSWTQLRQAGAAAREMLVKAAADKWGVPVTECEVEQGRVHHLNTHRMIGFGELVEEASKLEVPKEPKLKDAAKFTLIGKSVPRPDILKKVEGAAEFGLDVKLPGMLYASVERSPVFHGKVKSFDDRAAKKIAGVRHVLIAERKSGKNTYFGVAVVADNYFAALQGRKALEIEWDNTGFEATSTEKIYNQFRELAKKEGVVVNREGNFEGTYKTAAKKLDAVYEMPFAAHAPMEPQNTVANVTALKCEIWSPTQVPDDAVGTLAKYLNIPEGSIELHFTFLGGGFGRRLFDDYITEAAYISKEIKAPVKVVWTREDDMTMGPFRPGTLSSLKGGIDKNGKVIALQHKVIAPSIMYNQFGTSDPNKKEDSGAMEGISESWYEIPNVMTHNIYAETTVPIGWWRSVYSATTAFAHECFIDELANAAGKDPVDFRLGMINKNTRMKNLLQHLREKSEWDKPLPDGWSKGVAVWQFFAGQAGHVVFVSKKSGGGIKIEKVVAVIDCGLAVNPDNVKAQVEGGTIMGLSAAVKDEITFAEGKTVQQNFHQYRMLRMNEAPRVEVHIYPSSDVPAGVGEPGLPPVAPALGNAIFAATGKRIRKLPINLDNL
jgi:isoquinoline 1-oxidoreductase subunit beta